MGSDNHTLVTEHLIRGKLNHRLRFGIRQTVISVSGGLSYAVFKPYQTFGYVRWRRNKYGSRVWNLYICETVQGGRITQIPGVKPGANLLLRARGTHGSKRLLEQLDTLEKRVGGDLSVVPTSYWRELSDSKLCRLPLPKLNDYMLAKHAC